MLDRYFDNASTTPVDSRVREAMLPFLGVDCGNSQSLHSFGSRARQAVERARSLIAELLQVDDPERIIFTSGATESNNWVAQRGSMVTCSPFEHDSMRESTLACGGTLIPNDAYDLSPADESGVVCVIHVNNETGAIVDPPRPSATVMVHRDITQTLGRVPLPTGFDTASFSAHKLYGPKGIGGLIHSDTWVSEPLLYGGEHERSLRAGTLNVPAIVGFGEAARIAAGEMGGDHEHASELRSIVLSELDRLEEWMENKHVHQSPFILSVSIQGVEGQTLVEELDRRDFAISSGAACSSGSTEPSHVLTALGMEPEWIRGTIRMSFGRTNTRESARDLGQAIVEAVLSVRKLRRFF